MTTLEVKTAILQIGAAYTAPVAAALEHRSSHRLFSAFSGSKETAAEPLDAELAQYAL